LDIGDDAVLVTSNGREEGYEESIDEAFVSAVTCRS
jgi:hypothetical protein